MATLTSLNGTSVKRAVESVYSSSSDGVKLSERFKELRRHLGPHLLNNIGSSEFLKNIEKELNNQAENKDLSNMLFGNDGLKPDKYMELMAAKYARDFLGAEDLIDPKVLKELEKYEAEQQKIKSHPATKLTPGPTNHNKKKLRQQPKPYGA